MNLEDSQADAAFRTRVRTWIDENVPAALRGSHAFEDRVAVDRILAAGGLLGLTWPKEFGGGGVSAIEASIMDEEAARAGLNLAQSPSRLGAQMMAPALIVHGTAEQKARFLPPVINVEELWCQGFSEPDAGSDLAAVRTSATLVDGVWRVNGTKLWTTQAHHSDWCLLLVRTDADAPRHRNLTMMLLDMHQHGVRVSPILQLTGDHDFNELHLEDAAVPPQNVLGPVGEGWRVAMTTLSSERSYALRGKYVTFRRQLERVAGLVRRAGADRQPSWIERLGELSADVDAVRNLSYRSVSLIASSGSAAAIAPVAHLSTGLAHQRLVDFGYEVSVAIGEDMDYWYALWLETRAETIYGGAAQVQRNMIAERILGLPR